MQTVGKHGKKAANPGVIYEVDSRRPYLNIAFRIVPVVALLVAVLFTWPSDDQVASISADTTAAPNATATVPRRTTSSVDFAGEQQPPDAFAASPSTELSTTTTAASSTAASSSSSANAGAAVEVPKADQRVATTQPESDTAATTTPTTVTTQRAPTVPKALLASEPTVGQTTTSAVGRIAVTPTTGTRTTTTSATSTRPGATSAAVPTTAAPTSQVPTTARTTSSTSTRATTTTTRPTVATTGTPPTTAATTSTTARATTTAAPTTVTTLATTTLTSLAATTTTRATTTTTLPTTTTTTTAATTTTTQATTTTTGSSSGGNCDSGGEFQRVFRDDFSGSSLSGNWTQFNGAGNSGFGLRSSSALSVENGRLVITAEMVNGNLVSGGISHQLYQQYGKYVFRIRTDNDPSEAMSGVALTWPQSNNNRLHGENNIYETLANAVDRNPFYSFIHEPNGGPSDQKRFVHSADGSQFQTMTMEWTPTKISVTRSGPGGSATTQTQTLNETGGNLIPDNPHRISFQLDAWKQSISQPVTMEVDWVEVYEHCG